MVEPIILQLNGDVTRTEASYIHARLNDRMEQLRFYHDRLVDLHSQLHRQNSISESWDIEQMCDTVQDMIVALRTIKSYIAPEPGERARLRSPLSTVIVNGLDDYRKHNETLTAIMSGASSYTKTLVRGII